MLISLTAFTSGCCEQLRLFRGARLHACAAQRLHDHVGVVPDPYFDQPIMALAWGVFIAGFAQLAFQLPYVAKLGLLPRPRVKAG